MRLAHTWSCAAAFAPLSTNICTIGKSCLMQATCSGVLPSCKERVKMLKPPFITKIGSHCCEIGVVGIPFSIVCTTVT